MSREEILALVLGVAKAVAAGQVAVDQLEGMDLDQVEQASKDGWNKLDKIIEQGEKAGHE